MMMNCQLLMTVNKDYIQGGGDGACPLCPLLSPCLSHPPSQASHTILLYQLTANAASRSWREFPTRNEALDGVCRLYEERLSALNPGVRKVNYDIEALYEYVDGLKDLSMLMCGGL